MEGLFSKFDVTLETLETWKDLTNEQKKRFKHWLTITICRLSNFFSRRAIDDIFADETKLTNIIILFYSFFVAGTGHEATATEFGRCMKDADAADAEFSKQLLFKVVSYNAYYRYCRCNDSLDEITADDFKRLVAHGTKYEIVEDGYELKFIIADERLRCKDGF